MLDARTIRTRLAFIRHLHRVAVDQSQKPEPLQAASVLTFHDAVELFLHLTFEHCGGGAVPNGFLDYWHRLEHAAKPVQISGKVSMDRLNRARVSLKHYGLHPSPNDIDAIRASVTSFFEDNARSVFDLDFARISMVDLVTSPAVRSHLEQGEAAISRDDLAEAGRHLAISFDKLLREHDVIGNLTSRRPMSAAWYSRPKSSNPFFDQQADEERRWAADSVERLESAVRVMALGLDYRRLQRFQQTTPHVDATIGGDYIVAAPKHVATKDDCEDGLAFVVDCALRVQT